LRIIHHTYNNARNAAALQKKTAQREKIGHGGRFFSQIADAARWRRGEIVPREAGRAMP
jgi:hypothetical protein